LSGVSSIFHRWLPDHSNAYRVVAKPEFSAFKFACEKERGAAAAGKPAKRRRRAFRCHADFTKLQ
jgi:hypothetical protein